MKNSFERYVFKNMKKMYVNNAVHYRNLLECRELGLKLKVKRELAECEFQINSSLDYNLVQVPCISLKRKA